MSSPCIRISYIHRWRCPRLNKVLHDSLLRFQIIHVFPWAYLFTLVLNHIHLLLAFSSSMRFFQNTSCTCFCYFEKTFSYFWKYHHCQNFKSTYNRAVTMLLGVYLQQEEGTKITANSVSPGPIATNLFRYHSLIDGNSFLLWCFVCTWKTTSDIIKIIKTFLLRFPSLPFVKHPLIQFLGDKLCADMSAYEPSMTIWNK